MHAYHVGFGFEMGGVNWIRGLHGHTNLVQFHCYLLVHAFLCELLRLATSVYLDIHIMANVVVSSLDGWTLKLVDLQYSLLKSPACGKFKWYLLSGNLCEY